MYLTLLSTLALGLYTYRLTTATRNLGVNAIADALNSGTIEFWTGAQPGSPGGSESGNTQLGTCGFASTAFGSPATGVKTAASISSDTSADASGTCLHANLKTSAPASHSDASCGTSATDFVFDNNVIVSGGVIAVTSLTITVPQ